MTELSEERLLARPARHGPRLPPGLLPATILLLLLFGYGPNMTYALAAGAVLVLGAALLWRPGENPILLFLFGYQWLQASALIFLGNARHHELNTISKFGGHADFATGLSLLGILVFALGMQLGAGPSSVEQRARSRVSALEQPVIRWFWLYAAAAAISAALQAGAWVVPGLSQPILAMAAMRWALFFTLAYAVMARGQGTHPLFLVAFTAELVMGVGGYFADFRTVFFVTILAAVAAGVRLSARMTAGLVAGVVALGALSIVWTAVKIDYREFVSGGETAQVVKVDYGTRIAKLYELVTELDVPALEDAAETLVRRVSYVEFFGVVLDQVPALIPYENGKILKDAATRPFMPRIFFPNKTVIDDSERTKYYTGMYVAGANEGTSISLGWFAECYIDFGPYLMFLEVFAIGLAYGLIYRRLVGSRRAGPLMGGAMALAVLFFAAALESSITKVVGAVAVSLVMAVILIQFVLPAYASWALAGRRQGR